MYKFDDFNNFNDFILLKLENRFGRRLVLVAYTEFDS
jgi:hypothetical protein